MGWSQKPNSEFISNESFCVEWNASDKIGLNIFIAQKLWKLITLFSASLFFALDKQRHEKNNGKNSCDFSAGKLKTVFKSGARIKHLHASFECLNTEMGFVLKAFWDSLIKTALLTAKNAHGVRFEKCFPIECVRILHPFVPNLK